MSSEWQEVQIEEVCVLIVDCVNKTAPTVSEPTPYRMIRTTNIRNGTINLVDCRFVDELTYEKWTRRAKVQEGDVLLTREAPIGEVGIVKHHKGLFLGQRVMQYRANQNVLLPKFLLYSFLSPYLQSQFLSHEGSGSVVSHIRVGDCFKFKLKLPSLTIQSKIATILGALDDRITLLRETNTTLEAIAQALFKSWFVDFDPVHAKMQGTQPEGMDEQTAALFPDSFEESELGLVPKDWEVGTLGDMSKNNSTPFDFSKVEKVVFVNTGDVSNGEFLHQNYSLKEGLPGQAKKAIYEDDILFSEIRPKNGRFAYVNFDAKDYVVSTKFMVLRAINDIPPRYLYQVLRQTETIEYFNVIAESRSGTFPQITFDSVKNYKLIKPSSVCLEKYIECVNPIFHKVDLLNKQIQTLADLRDTLLPRLISGQLRVGEVDATT